MQGEFLKDTLFTIRLSSILLNAVVKDYLHGMEIHMKNGGLQPEGYIPLSNNQESTFMAMLVASVAFAMLFIDFLF